MYDTAGGPSASGLLVGRAKFKWTAGVGGCGAVSNSVATGLASHLKVEVHAHPLLNDCCQAGHSSCTHHVLINHNALIMHCLL